MEFRLLGPIEVAAAHGVVDLGPPRQRTVLAALLVDAGRPVMVDTVIDRVWGEDPPARARHALYVYIARIRRILMQADGPDPAIELVHRSGGYTLEVDPQRVDMHRFARLVAEANDLRRQGLLPAARLRQALDLWRDTPLADLSGQWAAQVRETWRRRHLDTAIMWARAQAGAGDQHSAIEPLTALVTDYPLAEPLAAELMRVLHATGLSTEALGCFADLRKRLIEELAIEPGPELQELHLAILRGQVAGRSPDDLTEPDVARSLIPVDVPRSPSPPTVPRQLPAAAWPFVGRPQELQWLTQLAQQPERVHTVVISAIDGAAGIGKTCLAVQWGHLIADRFPDGQLYINLRGFDPAGAPVEASMAIRTFLDALNVAPQRIPADLDAQSALLRTQLAGKRMLVVLDNARDVDHIRPLLPGTAGCLVVVTSRHRLTALGALQGASTLTLGLLSVSEARELLAARLGADRVAQEPAAVEEIITRCGNLPLALVIAAARVASQPQLTLTAVASQMRAAVLDALDSGDPEIDIRNVFSWSYTGVSEASARLFRLLGLHPGPDITPAAGASLAARGITQTKRLLAELTRAHLITEHQPNRFVFHDLLRLFAAEQATTVESQAQRRAAIHRLLDHYLHTTYAADRMINPHRAPIELPAAERGALADHFSDEQRALEWLAGERRVLVALIDYAVNTGWFQHAHQLDWTIAQYLYRCGQWIDQAATGHAAVAAAHRGSDPAAQARAHHNLARAHLQLGHHDLAHEQLTEAIRLANGTDDLSGQGDAHHVMSWVLERKGRHTEAFGHAMQALDLFETAANRFGKARVLNTIGWFHTQLGNHETAIVFCQEALTQLEVLSNKEGMAVTWHSIGYAHHNLGRYQAALRCYHQALALFAELQDRYYEADTLDSLGDTHHAIGNLDAAQAAWRRALPILEAINHPTAEAVRTKLHSCRPHYGQRVRQSDLTVQAAV